MWNRITSFIILHRFKLSGVIGILTIFFGFFAIKAEMSHNFASIVPSYDPEMQYFERFKKTFGEDANVFAVGLADKRAYELENFKALHTLVERIRQQHGVKQVLSLPQAIVILKDTTESKFVSEAIFEPMPQTQAALDSALALVSEMHFYDNQLINVQTGATLIAVSITKEVLDSPQRQVLTNNIKKLGDEFTQQTGIELHYAGVPEIRSFMTTKMASELKMLLMLSVVMTVIVLWWFFRSTKAIIVPLITIGVVVVWTMGVIVLLGYKINILTGLLPPILVVIGIPNSVYWITKYHQEYRKNPERALVIQKVVRHITPVALMTNVTTAIGFFVFSFMDTRILREFGVVSSIGVMSMFVVSVILLPTFMMWMPAPGDKELRHLDRMGLNKILDRFHQLIFERRPLIYTVVAFSVIVSLVGFSQLEVVSFMADDIPQNSTLKQDLAFFEQHFQGAMPLEIVVDTRKTKGVMNLGTLRRADQLQDSLNSIDLVSQPLSLVSFVKAGRQAFYNNPAFYGLPTNQDRVFILNYLKKSEEGSDNISALNNFVDSTGQQMRISLKVADVGSIKMDSLIEGVIRPQVAQIFDQEQYDVHITGTTLLFIKGNRYLVNNLKTSILIAIGLIAILMAFLFKSLRIIIVSIITNMLPLLITAGMMGFLGVALKPSTVLIFSIAFGIAVDDSIHYLARYRQGLLLNNLSVRDAVSLSLHETGAGMIYTSIILFFGFIIFIFSDFQGTKALGGLTSATLLCAMLANLLLLPALLLSLDKRAQAKKAAVLAAEKAS
ncbi:efflux RND transporter permease subunit [Eisenibacter elegans]|uniref:efflux RND transporter permease subunit n=1 Tax=Eisenibacter elegans TaxID=997 RepID=UPI00040F494D|nr:MMPL family transporter [Eisenibacter elegans]